MTEQDLEAVGEMIGSAVGFNTLVDQPSHTEDHFLIVTSEGDLVIESAGILFAVWEGKQRRGASRLMATHIYHGKLLKMKFAVVGRTEPTSSARVGRADQQCSRVNSSYTTTPA